VARDRQRAKQRKARRAQSRGPAPSKPYRADMPGELEHSSGDVDEFEARLVGGAGGEPLDASEPVDAPEPVDTADAVDASEAIVEAQPETRREAIDEAEDDAELDEELEEELAEEAVAAAPAGRREVATAPAPGTPTRRGPARFIGFLRASWAELQRVQWPDRRAVGQATAVVIGFVVVAGLYLGVADWVAKKIVDFII
jgi:preprotein translocase SecE subunit